MAEEIKEVQELTQQELSEQNRIRREKLAQMQEEGKDPFQIVKYDVTHHSEEIRANYDALEGKDVCIAGRLMSKRIMGKASFCNIQDRDGLMQSYVSKNDIGEEDYAAFKKYDIGDIIGIKGFVFKTKTGEISVHAKEVVLLSKSLQVLPEKFHGLKDQELRYRQRYVDLIVNPESRDTFIKRSKIITEIRKFLDSKGFLEVETPVLQTIPGGASARPFITHHNTLDIDMYCRIALELPLKRLIVGGFERVYEIGRVFRNEGLDTHHNPEFTELESYAAYWDYHDVMDEAEGIIRAAAKVVSDDGKITYQGTDIDLGKPFRRVHMVDLIKEKTGVDFWKPMTLEEATKIAEDHDIHVEKFWKVGHIINAFFEKYCEETIVDPTFVYGHPVEISPLAKKNADDPRFTDRFEIYIMGEEYGNAFSELNDPDDQRERFEAQMEEREAGNDEADMIDEDYLRAMEYGMPPTGGLGIGIDRLVMLLTDAPAIRDVLLFPTMRPERVESVEAEVKADMEKKNKENK